MKQNQHLVVFFNNMHKWQRQLNNYMKTDNWGQFSIAPVNFFAVYLAQAVFSYLNSFYLSYHLVFQHKN